MCKAVESCDSISASFLIAWGFSWSGTIAWEFLTRVSQKSTCHDRKKPHQLILPSRNMESIVLVTTKINVCHNRHMRKTSLRWCMMNAGVPYLLGRTGKQTDGLGTHQDTNYRPRSRGDNTFGSVRPSVCLSFRPLLFEPFELRPSFLAKSTQYTPKWKLYQSMCL